MSPPPAGRSRWTTRLLAKEVGAHQRLRLGRPAAQRPQAASRADLQGEPRSRVRREGARHRRALSPSPRARGGAQRGREDVDPGVGAHATRRCRCASGRATRHTHDYKRHGVVDLYAALEVATGDVTHRLSARHTAADFLAFMRQVVRAYPGRRLARHSRQLLDAPHARGPGVARRASARALPLHADQRVVAQSGRGLLRHPREAIAQHDGLSLEDAHCVSISRAYMRAWKKHPTPFAWTKPAHAIIKLTPSHA